MTESTYERVCEGAWIVASSDRAARALEAEFHRRQQERRLAAWVAPNIYSWQSFVINCWSERSRDARMVMSIAQEQAMWEQLIDSSHSTEQLIAGSIAGPRHRLAALARDAHESLCTYAPQYLNQSMRSLWQQDAEIFSEWLTDFDARCRSEQLLSLSRLPLELIILLRQENLSRPAVMLVGFDRLLPVQREVFEAWGLWSIVDENELAQDISFYQTSDASSELAACALWCDGQLKTDPNARLLVITQDVSQRRGEIERAFIRYLSIDSVRAFEFSLGVPLSCLPLARSALLLLRWFNASLTEHELDWLFSTTGTIANAEESAALQALMRSLRRNHLERSEWSISEFVKQTKRATRKTNRDQDAERRTTPFDVWSERMSGAANRLLNAQGLHSSLEWSALVSELLRAVGWPGVHSLSSAEHQTVNRIEKTIEDCGALGYDGRRIGWNDFRLSLEQTLNETLFSTESQEAPILIVGATESAGLTADGIWFLGAEEEQWPASGSMHPLLPIFVQREAGMPHATAELDWRLARSITERLLHSAPVVCFSAATLRGEVEAKPSRLIEQIAGLAKPLPESLVPHDLLPVQTEFITDIGGIAYPHRVITGGADVLTRQSQCAFQAFAVSRLNATGWEFAEDGLTPAQRGTLLHKVMLSIWSGPEQSGLRTLGDLKHLLTANDNHRLTSFVVDHVQRVIAHAVSQELQDRLPPSYIDLESDRLTRLVTEWLQYESERQEFEVVALEETREVELAGLTLSLRMDRMDKLSDGSMLVIDYKSGEVTAKMWQLPRPENIQLPLYAGFALKSEDENQLKESLGGLVFATINAKQVKFVGKSFRAKELISAGLTGRDSIVQSPLTDGDLHDWRDAIEQLAHEFVLGRSVVDPINRIKTCEYCGLEALCRIAERPAINEEEDEEEGSDASDATS